jgi:XTP/dITP diphosphohydrolase
LADDSGLEVDCLNGRPGVHSARYAGDGASDLDNNTKLLAELDGVTDCNRQAAFHCCLALWLPGGQHFFFDGYLHGEILSSPRGNGGFGYDPLFLVAEKSKTMAELSLAEKNALSHRGQALAQFRMFLANNRHT